MIPACITLFITGDPGAEAWAIGPANNQTLYEKSLSILAIAAALLGLPAFRAISADREVDLHQPDEFRSSWGRSTFPRELEPRLANPWDHEPGFPGEGDKRGPGLAADLGATLGGTTTIPSGATVSGASGASIGFDQVTISRNAVGSDGRDDQGIVDSLGNLIYIVVPPKIVNDLSGPTGASVGTVSRFCPVRNSTSGDGAMGLWIWDPTSTTAEGGRRQKSSNLDPGRSGPLAETLTLVPVHTMNSLV